MGGKLDGNFLLGSLSQVYFDCHIDYLLCGEYIFFSSLIANVTDDLSAWKAETSTVIGLPLRSVTSTESREMVYYGERKCAQNYNK